MKLRKKDEVDVGTRLDANSSAEKEKEKEKKEGERKGRT